MEHGKTSNDAEKAPPMMDEADIGSGERTPGQRETDEIIKEIPTQPPAPPSQPG